MHKDYMKRGNDRDVEMGIWTEKIIQLEEQTNEESDTGGQTHRQIDR